MEKEQNFIRTILHFIRHFLSRKDGVNGREYNSDANKFIGISDCVRPVSWVVYLEDMDTSTGTERKTGG